MNRPIVSQVQNEKLIVDRRERIIRAAITVFRRSGFHVATTKDIAHEADLTQSNLYNYVSSKHDVLFLVCEHLVQLYQGAVDETITQHDDAHGRLVEALRSVITVMSAHRDEVQLLYNETHALEKADRKIILSSIAKLIKSSKFFSRITSRSTVPASSQINGLQPIFCRSYPPSSRCAHGISQPMPIGSTSRRRSSPSSSPA